MTQRWIRLLMVWVAKVFSAQDRGAESPVGQPVVGCLRVRVPSRPRLVGRLQRRIALGVAL